MYGKKKSFFLLENEGGQENGLYEKSCINELSNYLGGCIEKRSFLLFEGEKGARIWNILKRSVLVNCSNIWMGVVSPCSSPSFSKALLLVIFQIINSLR